MDTFKPTTSPRTLKALSVAALAVALSGLAQAQSYRETYPLTDTTSLNGLSVNMNLHEPSEAQLQQVVDAGFKFIRYEFTWEGIERKKGVYDWSVIDPTMARAKAKGLRVMALLAFGNPLYTADTGAPNTASSRAAFARFAAAAAARYARQGVIWEIYNEPNLPGWWRNPNAADYAALVNATADAIRGVSSEEWIVGLTTEMLRADNRAYIEAVVSTPGVLAKLDGIGFHPYTQDGPETMGAQWAAARALIESKRPADHPVALLAGEVGYHRDWAGITADVQASYTVRLALFNLSQGIGFTNIYSYDDVYGSSAWQSSGGLTSYGSNVPYAAYYAVQKMTGALKGYRFSKRLDLGRVDDYCLLFSKVGDPTDCKIVCWTTSTPHGIKVPSSPVSFTQVPLTVATTRALVSNTVTATAAGLSVNAANEPILFASNGPNPLVNVAAAWTKLPSSVMLSTRADGLNQLGSMIVSPAWAGMPTAATLKIEDVAAPVLGYTRPSYTANLTNLSKLTLNSPEVQTVFNSLAGLQDAMGAARNLRFTLSLPDGTSVTQATSVVRKQPMTTFATTPQSGALTLRVENPSGAPYVGSLKASTGSLNETQAVRLVQGEMFKMVYFTTLPTPSLASDLKYGLYDSGSNALFPADPVLSSAPQTVYRTPNFFASEGYSVTLGGTKTIAGTGTLGYGISDWSFTTGGATADVRYSFGAGGSKYIMLNSPASMASVSFAKVPLYVGMWMKGDGSKNVIRAIFLDAANQTFQVTGPAIDWTGWKWVSIPVAGNFTAYWGGPNDGVVHGALRCVSPFLLDSNQMGTSGSISICGATIIGQK